MAFEKPLILAALGKNVCATLQMSPKTRNVSGSIDRLFAHAGEMPYDVVHGWFCMDPPDLI
jgi:hypothetical protein